MFIKNIKRGAAYGLSTKRGQLMTKTATNAHKGVVEHNCDLSVQQALEILNPIMDRYKGSSQGALIPILQSAQNLLGYLPKEILIHISENLHIPYSEVAGVVTFYSYFTTVARGVHTIRVCLGTACYVRGGKEVLDALRKELHVEVGQTTADKQFTLEIGRCFGACGLAPVVMIDETVHQRVKPSRIKHLLEPYKIEQPQEEVEHEHS